MIKKAILLIILFSLSVQGQDKEFINLKNATLEELKMTAYEKDSSARAVVLNEKGHVYFNIKGRNRYTREYYVKIKILKKSGFDKATVQIPFYKSSRVKSIEAITYNLKENGEIEKTLLEEKDIFKEKFNKSFNIKSFSIPNVKVGSVIEYKYTYSRNSYGVYDWDFQTDIPKVKSVYKAYLSGRPKFKIRLIGFLKPSLERAELKKKCVGVSRCSELYYEMEDVPAFVEEKYLTSKYNYLSRLTFEREYYNSFVKKGDEQDWKALDKGFKRAYYQDLNSDWYYKKHLPKHLFEEKNALQRAKNIYSYIQKIFTKDNSSKHSFDDVFEKKTGSSFQINFALYNALKAANLDVKIMFLSTRKNGFVTKLHATVEDFNYNIIKLHIDGKDLFLDANDKLNPFGLLPFMCLNGEGRVVDFDKGSNWHPIKSTLKSGKTTKVALTLKDGKMEGDIYISRKGYDAKFKRSVLEDSNKETYMEAFESRYPNIEIDSYSNENVGNLNLPLKEFFKASIELDDLATIKINPFVIGRLEVNPFKLNERLYPVDYGYKRSERYLFSLTVPDEYEIKKMPRNKVISLPNKGGSMKLSIMKKGNEITLFYTFNLAQTVYSSIEYHYLKEFYNRVIKNQDTFIELEKK